MHIIAYSSAGGSSLEYLRLKKTLSPNIEILHQPLPDIQGRSGDDCVQTTWSHLLDHMWSMCEDIAVGSYAFMGHSLGARIAFEMASLAISRKANSPLSLIVSSSRSPSVPHRGPYLHTQGDEALLEGLVRRGAFAKAALNQSFFRKRSVLPKLRTEVALAERWPYCRPSVLPINILALSGREDRCDRTHEMEEWKQFTSAKFRLVVLPNGHHHLGPCAPDIATAIRSALVGDEI